MNKWDLVKFFVFFFLPLILGGISTGVVFGGVGYLISHALELYVTDRQKKLVFWVIMSFGGFGGIAMAFQALFAFIKIRNNKD